MLKKEENLNRLADIFKALSNPIRLMIIYQLVNKSCINADLVNDIPKAQATISQHVKVLVKAELITSKQVGKYSIYNINSNSYHEMIELIQQFTRNNQIKLNN